MCLCGHADELHNQYGMCTVSGCECAGDAVGNVPPIESEITVINKNPFEFILSFNDNIEEEPTYYFLRYKLI